MDHPVVSAGMGGGAAGGELAGAVPAAGGLGIVGASWLDADAMRAEVERARQLTSAPIGINLLLFGNEELVEPALELEPAVLSTAWPRDDQDLSAIFASAHERGAKVMHMVPTLADAVAAGGLADGAGLAAALALGAAGILMGGAGLARRAVAGDADAVRGGVAREGAGAPPPP